MTGRKRPWAKGWAILCACLPIAAAGVLIRACERRKARRDRYYRKPGL